MGRGETVYSIARLYDVDVRDIIELNRLRRPDRISIGQNLLIPGYRGPGEGGPPLPPPGPSRRPCATAKAAPRTGSSQGLLWPPTDGRVLDGPKRNIKRAKVSITARQGAPVWAAADGQVVYAGEQSGYGLMVVVRHKQLSIMTVYAQASAICVGIGSQVRRGDVIALVGRPGRRGRARLYFELLNGDDPVPSGR